MTDWEFWGKPKIWKGYGIGLLLMIFGSAVHAMGVGMAIAGIPIFIGILMIWISTYYFAFSEWLLLRKE